MADNTVTDAQRAQLRSIALESPLLSSIFTRWDKYEAKFGHSVTPPTSAGTATTDGLRPGLTYGLSDLLGSVVRPNKRQITREIYEIKIERWTTSWIGLTVIGWNE
ncbi:hypothetical protein [Nguyenibacter sp. L1]|uniref:hypothetical protein n=1 Tax=Nguyenibacter sp. L1 TaxID=3049350 RepID=UPI002B49C823|nr:hypothetical protein [Nguyenibacter sp. L1]WRH89371.1 hypothetical protein QN315_07170 [Nguyenibacter sp. L1]